MNTITDKDRKLAETLKSLTLEPMAQHADRQNRQGGWAILGVGVILLAAAGSIPIFWPSVIKPVTSYFAGQTNDQTPVVASEAASIGSSKKPHAGDTAAAVPPTSAREIAGSGYVVAPRTTTVFPKYQGHVIDVTVDAGSQVEAGQVLVRLDDAGARFSLEQAEAAQKSAELTVQARRILLDQATSSLRRRQALAHISPRQDLEDAQTQQESALNDLAQAQQDLDKAALSVRIAQEQVDELTVRAPIAGTVTRIGVHVGDTVLERADSVKENQSLLAITDMSSLVIDADVAETNLSLLKPGLRGEAIFDGLPDETVPVEIGRLAPVVSSDKGTISVRLSLLAPKQEILPGMAAQIRLILPHKQIRESDK